MSVRGAAVPASWRRDPAPEGGLSRIPASRRARQSGGLVAVPGATEFQVLGPVQVSRGGHRIDIGRRRERLLLGLLLLQANAVVGIDRLLTLLWDDNPTAQARASLHSHVSRLRRLLDPGGTGQHGVRIDFVGGGYRVQVAPERIDAHRFRSLVSTARGAPNPVERAGTLRRALALWHGPVLADVAPDRLRDRITADLSELRLSAADLAVDAELACGRHEELIADLVVTTTEQPLRERPVDQLMVALYRAGRQQDALAAYHRLRERLADELGLDPAPELQRRHAAILRHDPALAWEAGPERVDVPTGDQASAVHHVLPVPAQLPPAPGRLVGREAALRALDGRLSIAPDAAAVSLICGMAGVGKTALVTSWGHRVADRFPDGQLFIDLNGHSTEPPRAPGDVLGDFLAALGIAPDRIPAGSDQRAALYRSILAGKRVLVVLDNAATADQVRPLLPAAPACLALVTSRESLGGLVASNNARPIGLDQLGAQDAARLLADVLGPQWTAADPAATRALATLCGHLPLALRIAAAQAITRSETAPALVARLRAAGPLAALRIPNDPRLGVRAALDLSYRALDEPARLLVRRLGLAPGGAVSPHLAAALLDTTIRDAKPLLERLAQAHLLHQERADRYRPHDLVREYAVERQHAEETQGDRHAAIQRVRAWYLRTPTPPTAC